MKNFSDLLATDLALDIKVNGQVITANLDDQLTFKNTDTVSVDGIELLPRYRYLAVNGILEINEPFYCWYHRVSGQGWLLEPQ